MTVLEIRLRPAEPGDASALAAVHDAAWLEAYRGIIPGRELNRMVGRRGAAWWRASLARRDQTTVLDYDGQVIGYATTGPSRSGEVPFKGEVYELYMEPVFQGLGFGRLLFVEAMRQLRRRALRPRIVWSLADNVRAVGFYRHLGGKPVATGIERFGSVSRPTVALGWS